MLVKSGNTPPLEAGRSILDCKRLPEELISALNYVSSRLLRKRLHLPLIIIRKEDTSINPLIIIRKEDNSINPLSESMAAPCPTPSPTRSLFDSSPTPTLLSPPSRKAFISSCTSLSRTKWPSLPVSPRDISAKPAVRFPLANMGAFSNPYGISLMHSSALTSKAEKILRQTMAKAEKKICYWPLTSDITCPVTNELIYRSLKQNSILYSSAGLTLFALDHTYTFKAYLEAYSKSLSTNDLTIAVEELHRLVLARKGHKVSTAYLLRAYQWLPTSLSALFDINEGYKTAYGADERAGGIDFSNEDRNCPPPLQTSFDCKEQTSQIKLPISGDEIKRQSTVLLSPVEVGAQGTDGSVEDLMEDSEPHVRGAIKPKSNKDITPRTKDEWISIFKEWDEARTPVVKPF
ncbi:hypothetical protein B7494_g770 [Chlorociboria aeruginascens]|nr:hypothetical protein B7494_g770 [Chlorociboria aeruginascens]